MRAGIDIAEVESRTKIRAKYLRALENEEWSLLPGTTFVKSFLRTYAETLGLDAKLLVEEYKFRHEPYEVAQGGQGGGPQRGRRGGRRAQRGGGGAFGPQKRTNLLPILFLIVIVVGAIYAVVQLGKSEDETPAATPTTTATTETRARSASDADELEARRARRAARRVVSLRITAPRNEAATVCVRDARGRRVANDLDLQAGRSTKRLRSSRFDVALSGGVVVRDGGKRLRLTADDKNVVAYRITKNRARRLSDDRKPSCS